MATDQHGDDVIQIANEFAHIRVRKVYTRNGERLEISAPRRGYRILLDALELESLTWQTSKTFSEFLAASVGDDGQEEPPAPVDELGDLKGDPSQA